ncbi:MAG: hypothetical protein LBN39_08995 [Planctomycetaceae bacterium]|jgi:hypothetical protein|nr:hypothetical protein [Planctomycetaceae bacterium]
MRTFLILLALCCLTPLLAAEQYGQIYIVPMQTIAGNNSTDHGYVEHRFRITNKDTKPHRVALSMPDVSYANHSAYLSRTANSAEVPAQSSVIMQLLQPPMELTGVADTRVVIDGRTQRDPLHHSATLGGHGHLTGWKSEQTAFVLVSVQGVPGDISNQFLMGFQTGVVPDTSPMSPAPPFPPAAPGAPKVISCPAIVPVSEWSDSFLSYTQYDGVAISSAEWKELQEKHQNVFNAIRQYVEAGGILLIVGTDWTAPKEWAQFKEFPSTYLAGLGRVFVMEKDTEKAKPQMEPFRQLVLKHQEFWANLFGNRYHRYGGGGGSEILSGDTPLLTSMPVVEESGISIRLILTLIVIFAVLIGPVNLYVLSKIKRRLWLLWTVPAISLFASMLVFGVSFLKEGFLRQASSQTCTILDQRREEAVSFGFIGYYSTLSPGGVVFSPNTEATLCANRSSSSGSSRPLEVDILPNGGQLFTGRWVLARVPSYFLVRKTESMRKERMLFDWTATPPTATNGLGADIDELTVCSAEGTNYRVANVRAGEKTVLEEIGRETPPPLDKTLQQLHEDYKNTLHRGTVSLSAKQLPNTYRAILPVWNPFIEPGIDRMKPYQNKTVIYGFFE